MKAKLLAQYFLIGNAILAASCATVGSKLDLQLAQEAETKGCEDTYQGKGISLEDCKLISETIKEITTDSTGKYGFVGYDKDGNIQLKGSYKDEEEIETAFMVAATVVGVDKVGVSDVTPRELGKIKMTKSFVIPKETGGKPNKYALLIGVSKFQDAAIYSDDGKWKSGVTPIESAGKDADLLADILEKNGFDDENITVIKDEDATKSNIEAAMRDLASKVTSKDTVVFYISTHGTPPNQYGKTGILPFDIKTNFNKNMADFKSLDIDDLGHGEGKVKLDNKNVQVITRIAKDRAAAIKTAISFDDLQNFMTNIKTNKFIAILDTCFSGSALQALTKPILVKYAEATNKFVSNYSEKDQKALINNAALSCPIDNSSNYEQAQVKATLQELFSEHNRSGRSAGAKGLMVVDDNNEPVSGGNFAGELQSIKQKTNSEKSNSGNLDFLNMEKFYRGIDSETPRGRVLLTATTGNEKSWFDPSIFPNSFFTYYLARGLEKHHGRVFQAFDYAQLRTQMVTAARIGKHQTPQMTSTPEACANIDLSN